MKTRNGFVSNSSSSSFVIIASSDAHKQAMEKLTEYQRAVMKELVETKDVFGKKAYVIGNMNDMGGYSTAYEEGWQPKGWDEKIEELENDSETEEEFSPGKALYAYEELVKEQPKTEWFYWESNIG